MNNQEALSAAVAETFDQQVAFLRRLVQTKSTNPFTPETAFASAPVEREVAEVTRQELHRLGFNPELHSVSPERPNVLCHIPGSDNSKKTLILTTHMDTVEPADYTRDPWEAQIEENRLYGVGAADAKAQMASFIYAAYALRKVGIKLAGQLTLAFVVDEESGACSPYGTQSLLKQGLLRGDAAIVGEPGNRIISIGHRGLYRFRLTIYGEATHTGGRSWEQGKQGHNAILDMARVSVALSHYLLPSSSSAAFPDRKSVLTFPTVIHGGTGINIVPSSCEAYGDVRLLPGLSPDEIKQLIKDQLARLSITTYRLDDLLIVPPAETNPKSEVVQTLAAAVEAITGVQARLEGAGPTCDGWMFIIRGIPTVCGYGVKCEGVHGADEWVDLHSLRMITEIYAQTILHYLRTSL